MIQRERVMSVVMGVVTGLTEVGRNCATILSTYVSWLRRIISPVDFAGTR